MSNRHGWVPVSYPDVSLSVKKCAQRKARRRHPFHGPLRVITSHSPLPCEKRSAWGGGWMSTIWIEWKENKVATRRGRNVLSDSAQKMHFRLLVLRRILIYEYYESVWGNENAEFSDEIFIVQKKMWAYHTARIGAPFQARTLPLFLELGWPPINQICIERRLLLFKKNPGWTSTGLPLWQTIIFEISQVTWCKVSVALSPSYSTYQ